MGDQDAQREDPRGAGPQDIGLVYDRFFSRVYSYVRYRVADRETADDLTSEIFMKALEKLDTYRPDKAPLGAWLFAIARNAVSDHYRRLSVRRWLSLDFLPERPGREPAPDQGLERDESLARLSSALERLDPRERDVLGLKFACDMANKDIAAMTGLTESNVGVIVFRAVKKLQAQLKGEGA